MDHCGYYNAISTSFIKGDLSLPVKVNPLLAKLDDPYDSNKNDGLRIHDCSYYKGKYYLYFTPIPVLLFNVPYKLLTEKGLPSQLSGLLFACGAFLFSALLIIHLKK